MYKYLKLLSLFMLVSSALLYADSKTKEDEDISIIDAMSGKHGFEMEFEQRSYYTFTRRPRVLKGKAKFSPPRRFIWETKGRDHGKIISNGDRIWIYTPAEEEMDRASLIISSYSEYKGPESVIFDPDKHVSMLDEKDAKKVLKIDGKEDNNYKWLKISFKQKDKKLDIHEIEFEDLNGTRILISVKKFIRTNKPYPVDIFEFKAPEGVRVIN